jgi:hypothetical protein
MFKIYFEERLLRELHRLLSVDVYATWTGVSIIQMQYFGILIDIL